MNWPPHLFYFILGFFTAYLILLFAIFIGKFIRVGHGRKDLKS